jgi:hypothetical protein
MSAKGVHRFCRVCARHERLLASVRKAEEMPSLTAEERDDLKALGEVLAAQYATHREVVERSPRAKANQSADT